MIALTDYPPPAQYDRPYACPSPTGCEVVMPLDKVRKVCSVFGVHVTRGYLYACSVMFGPDHVEGAPWPVCTIIMPEVGGEITKTDQKMLRRVENANCNGWPKGNRE